MIADQPAAHIDPSAVIGEGTTIGHGAYVGPGVTIGRDCRIGAGTVIGEPGFGYTRQPDGSWEPKAHDYGVVIGDEVHIGALTNIHRGSWRDTRIGRGTRIDARTHVAHNVWLGEDVMVVAGVGLGGSVTVGDGAWLGLNACVQQRVTIGEKALVAMGAVVLTDVAANVTVAGVPARVINATVGVREQM